MEWVVGSVQHYAWGDHDYIPRLLECEPDGAPWAEWWLGTHPGAPSRLADGRSLSDHCGELPYLLKVLAADDALSLQTHPSREQAEAGFERETAAGLPIDAPDRIYRDRSPKPELLCALTSFDALCGFRPVRATIALCDELGALTLAASLRTDGLAATVDALYRGSLDPAPIIEVCAAHDTPEAALVTQLAGQYPGDPSVVVTLLLNRVVLSPGEALFLGPGNLHAYLHGAGVEIMSASDNVVRGGLTTKHVDVDELLDVVVIEPLDDPLTFGREDGADCWRYDTPGTPFRLWRFEVAGTFTHTATGRELVLCADGATDVIERGETVVLMPGEELRLHGIATLFRVEEIVPENIP
ncbi:MAG: mannose-6-phosphate isomerase, class I [Ilumatobacteraceae bacterium]